MGSHPSAALEYRFFKLNQGELSILADWIARRRVPSETLRVSVRSSRGVEVYEIPQGDLASSGAPVLGESRTSNGVGDVRWDLSFKAAPARIRPGLRIAQTLRMLDLTYESVPWVSFSGWIEHRGERFNVVDALGMIAHYWGPRLLPDWWWVSVNQFGERSKPLALELNVLRSHLWGTRITTRLGFLWLDDGETEELVRSPPARLTITGDPKNFLVDIKQLRGSRYRLVATGRHYADLGDQIGNTLVGDLEVWRDDDLIGKAIGTASLERRPYPTLPE